MAWGFYEYAGAVVITSNMAGQHRLLTKLVLAIDKRLLLSPLHHGTVHETAGFPHREWSERVRRKVQCLSWSVLWSHTPSYPVRYLGQLSSVGEDWNMCWNTKRQGSSVAILEAGYHIGPLNFYHMTDCVLLLWHLSKIILFISLRPTSSSQECELPESKDFFFFFFMLYPQCLEQCQVYSWCSILSTC